MNNVLDYLENSAMRFPDKTAVKDDKKSCTYHQFLRISQNAGAVLTGYVNPGNAVCVFAEKSVDTLAAFMGTVYAGCFYTLIDPSFPRERILAMLSVLKPAVIVDGSGQTEKLEACGYAGTILRMEELVSEKMEELDEKSKQRLADIRTAHTDIMPLYCNFTSGSTGIPKGVLVAHRSVIEFIDIFTELFSITNHDVIGNQAPFDFDVSVKDIYSTFKTGATLVIIPKSYFMFPNAVVDMLDDNHVTTLIWAVSALCLLNRLHGLKHKVPSAIQKIMFSGEMMPIRQLNAWRAYYPDAMFVNLYGPTEITCNCTYHILDRDYAEDETLPIGKAFPNEHVFLLSEDGYEIKNEKSYTKGELCVSGTTLALGYYRNHEQTQTAFVQNPLNQAYPEIIYKTGDVAYYGEDGLLYFAGRKDFQIKHMGHRIELEEIEQVLLQIPEVTDACCFYDSEKNKVIAVYIGPDDKKYLIQAMKSKVPEYMVPNVFLRITKMPLNKNGKTDKKLLQQQYRKGELS